MNQTLWWKSNCSNIKSKYHALPAPAYPNLIIILLSGIALTELWRLRLNFMVLVVFNFVEGIGETSTLSTFHQFITNPQEPLNNTQSVSVHAIVTFSNDIIYKLSTKLTMHLSFRVHV